jgi:hypothetical protein
MGDTVIREVTFLHSQFPSYATMWSNRLPRVFGRSPGSFCTERSDPAIHISSSPFARYGVFPIGGRSTAVKLRDGGVWLLASTPLDHETKTKINELGPVKYVFFNALT